MRKIPLHVFALFVVGIDFTLPATSANSTKLPAQQITFSKDFALIFFKNCVQCHSRGEAAPFSVLSYKDLRAWAKSIKGQVVILLTPDVEKVSGTAHRAAFPGIRQSEPGTQQTHFPILQPLATRFSRLAATHPDGAPITGILNLM